jgi:hypothetical protein
LASGRSSQAGNPFRVGGLVQGEFFADREVERARIRRALTEPQAHLLVFGMRRMGKSSTLDLVRTELEAEGKPVLLADLSTATTLADVTTRLLQAAGQALGRRWTDVVGDLLKRVTFRFSVQADPSSGQPVFGVEPGIRESAMETQRGSFGEVLAALEAMAAARRTHLGVILDEFQELHRFGGVAAEAHLRGIIQRQRRVTYVLAGSDERLIAAMQGKGRPFYQLLKPLPFGPIEPGYLAAWIERRLGSREVTPAPGLGALIVGAAGPRTRDIVRLARGTFERARGTRAATRDSVEEAFQQIVADEDAAQHAVWGSLSRLQQDVLRAVAAGAGGLTTRAVRQRFALGASGAATKAAQTLVGRDVLVKQDGGGYAFDSPFFRVWVVVNALPDLGIHPPVPGVRA